MAWPAGSGYATSVTEPQEYHNIARQVCYLLNKYLFILITLGHSQLNFNCRRGHCLPGDGHYFARSCRLGNDAVMLRALFHVGAREARASAFRPVLFRSCTSYRYQKAS